MSNQEETFLKRITLSQKSRLNNSYEFTPVSHSYFENCLEHSIWDVDFIALYGKPERILNDSHVSAFLGSPQCKIFKKACLIQVRCSEASSTLVFATLGEYKLGVSIANESHRLDNYIDQFDIAVSEEEFPLSSKKTSYWKHIDDIRKFVNSRLNNISQNNLIPYRDAIREIINNFDQEIIIFRYGQKQLYSEVSNILSIISSKFLVDIALAVELETFENFMLVDFSHYKNNDCQFYSNFYDDNACNMLVKNVSTASNIIPFSYRIVAYNTFQHSKKSVNFYLKTDSEDRNSNNSLAFIPSIRNRMKENIDNIENVINSNINRSKMRVEVYFRVSTINSIENMLNNIRNFIISDAHFVSAPKTSVKNSAIANCRFLKFALSKIYFENYSGTFMLLYLYDRIVRSIFALDKINPNFIQNNWGFCLKKDFFLVNTSTIKPNIIASRTENYLSEFENLFQEDFNEKEKVNLQLSKLNKYYRYCYSNTILLSNDSLRLHFLLLFRRLVNYCIPYILLIKSSITTFRSISLA